MVYRGKVHNGHIVLEAGARLAEGTEVHVEPVGNGSTPAMQPPKGSADAILPFAGIWADQAEEMEHSRAELRAMKDEEVRRQRSEPDPQL